jgi:uncharacterized protein (DUF433 family)
MTISSPCGTPITARTRVCRHLTRLDLQDCMACADEAELAERLPTSTLTARLPLCQHGTRLDLQDCIQCAAELAKRLPHDMLAAACRRAGMKP